MVIDMNYLASCLTQGQLVTRVRNVQIVSL